MSDTTDDGNDWIDILGSGDLTKRTVSYDGDTDDVSNRPTKGQKVKIRLTSVTNGEAHPDKSENKEFIIGDNDVPYFLELVLPMMHLTEVCRIRSSSKFDDERQENLNDHAEYEVHLIDVQDVPPLKDWTVEARIEAGAAKKMRGNKLFDAKKYDSAILSFRKGVKYLTEEIEEGPEALKELASTCLTNLAAVYLKISNFSEVISCCEGALLLNTTNIKAFYRKAKAFRAMKKYTEASESIQQLLTIDPQNHAGRMLQKDIQKEIDRSKKAEKELFKKMVSALDGSSKDVQKIVQDKERKDFEEKEAAREARNTRILWGLLGLLIFGILASTFYKIREIYADNQPGSVIDDSREL
eukprot:m.298794 g.298794  ORF g.298794 m.298794 type:complete len:355 (+) comp20100_c0_seq1:2238-3302(+)